MLVTIVIIVGLIGLLLIILGVIPATSAHIPGGVGIGITLLVISVVLYVVLTLVATGPVLR